MNKSYSELIKYKDFNDRYEYLKYDGIVGDATFGGHRYLNQMLYNSREWKDIRSQVIIRDEGFDLAHKEYPIYGFIYVHHINPITIDDILNGNKCVFDLNNLISVSFKTHNAIHYGNCKNISKEPIVRKQNDTCPWKR